ncbi:DUF4350 domain-containing protein [Agilicoccus flavus]|uniref:DUF4350 domain-containing protein n=1 Tax=Agilicoccus flavus TaxID=2775968 RepID=UPI001CF66D0A|nr:DUF4350 domain-containing protein [Agilicoccus flavus]
MSAPTGSPGTSAGPAGGRPERTPARSSSRSGPRRGWGRRVAIAALVLLGGGVVALGSAPEERIPLDPTGAYPEGARALAQVLDRSYGVRVEPVRGAAALRAARVDSGTTLLVTHAGSLSAAAADGVTRSARGARRLVLLDPAEETLTHLGVPVAPADGPVLAPTLRGGCSSTDVDPGDTIDLVGEPLYRATGAGDVCLRPDVEADSADSETPTDDADGTSDGGAYVRVAARGTRPETVVLGLSPALSNEAIGDDDASAAVALRTLRHGDRVLWYLPSPDDGAPLPTGTAVVPAWFGPGVALTGVALLTLCLWRGRRFGPLVVEPLPAVVPAVETVHARARLYARSGDARHALDLLRRGTSERIARRLGLPPEEDPAIVARHAAERTGLPPDDVRDTLTGVDVTPAQLPARAARLRRLEREVDRP